MTGPELIEVLDRADRELVLMIAHEARVLALHHPESKRLDGGQG